MTTNTEAAHSRPSVGVTLLIVIASVPFMAGLFALYKLLGVSLPYYGVLFLLYWAATLHRDPKAFLPSVLGALGGILLAWLLVAFPPLVGPVGAIFAYAVLGVVLFCYTRGQALFVVNNATLLFVLGAAIPELKIATNVVDMVESLLIAAAYMGVVALALHAITKFRAKKPALNGAANPAA